jgi:hypothetical protein
MSELLFFILGCVSGSCALAFFIGADERRYQQSPQRDEYEPWGM